MSEVVSPHWSNEEWTWLERRAAAVQRRGFNAALEYGQSASGEPIAAISVDCPDGRFRVVETYTRVSTRIARLDEQGKVVAEGQSLAAVLAR